MKIVNIARVMIILIRFSSYIGFGQGSLGWHMLEGFFVCLFVFIKQGPLSGDARPVGPS